MIYNLDCVPGAQMFLDDNSVDMIITDPPYNLGYGGTRQRRKGKEGFGKFANDELSETQYRTFTAAWLREAYRVLKPGRHIYVFIDWRQYPLMFWFMQHIGFNVKNCIVWDKVHMGLGWQYRYRHEFVIFAVKDSIKRRRPPRSLPAASVASGRTRRVANRSMTDILAVPKLSADKMTHPTEKPVELITPFVLQSSETGELVADFFVGSGSIAEAALREGRRFTGFEIAPIHFHNATKRMESCIQDAVSIKEEILK